MRISLKKSFRDLLLIVVYLMGIFGIVASGGGGGGGGGGGSVSFPIPTLPANAVTLDATNAREIAESTVEFAGIISSFVVFKAEGSPSMPQVIKLVIDQAIKRNRRSGSVAARTEDISALFCFTGTAINTFTESANSVSGTIRFSNCDLGGGVVLNGTFPYDASWNDTTLDYNLHYGGTLTFDFGTDFATIVLNIIESGNDGTGDFSSDINFSLDGLPDGGFLVTTDENDLWTGNFYSFDFTSGTLIVEGANFTFLNIIVAPPNMADVWLDEGLGGSYFTTIPITP